MYYIAIDKWNGANTLSHYKYIINKSKRKNDLIN
jgi:hypothetical protein